MRRHSGFTILEIIVVLLLLTILAATVLGRSALPDKLDLNSATEKLRLQLRYAQAQAMKRSDTVWGIKCNDNVYWLFRDTNPDDTNNQFRIPGADYTTADNKVRPGSVGVDRAELHGLLRAPDRQAVRAYGVTPTRPPTRRGGRTTRPRLHPDRQRRHAHHHHLP